jgi:hypothetical protein
MGKVFAKIGMVGLVLGVGLALAAPAVAGTTINVGGVKVQYSKTGGMDAYYNAGDDTLTIVLSESGGTLVVTATADAPLNWGSYVDTVIFGFGVDVKNIILKGRTDAPFFVAGEMNHCDRFMVKNGFVGGTDYYGDTGLYSDSGGISTSIKIFNGVAIGPVFVYASAAVAPSQTKSLPFVPPSPGFNKQLLIDGVRTATPAE